MRVASLPRFRPSPLGARAALFVLLLVSAAAIVLLAFGASDAAAAEMSPDHGWYVPFRW